MKHIPRIHQHNGVHHSERKGNVHYPIVYLARFLRVEFRLRVIMLDSFVSYEAATHYARNSTRTRHFWLHINPSPRPNRLLFLRFLSLRSALRRLCRLESIVEKRHIISRKLVDHIDQLDKAGSLSCLHRNSASESVLWGGCPSNTQNAAHRSHWFLEAFQFYRVIDSALRKAPCHRRRLFRCTRIAQLRKE